MKETVDWYSVCVSVSGGVQGQRNKGQKTLNVLVQHYERRTESGRHMRVHEMYPFSFVDAQRRTACHLGQELPLELLSSSKTRVMASTCHSDYY